MGSMQMPWWCDIPRGDGAGRCAAGDDAGASVDGLGEWRFPWAVADDDEPEDVGLLGVLARASPPEDGGLSL